MWWEIIGWTGSALVVIPLVVASVRRFRWLNLTGSAIATAYNVALGIWPFAAMNAIISVIDVYWLVRLGKESRTADGYDVVVTRGDDPMVAHLLRRHGDDVASVHPGTAADTAAARSGADDAAGSGSGAARDGAEHAFVLMRGDEVIGLTLVRPLAGADGTGEVTVDYVTPRFRDYGPGTVLYRENSRLWSGLGLSRLVLRAPVESVADYARKVGFRPAAAPGTTGASGDLWLDLPVPAAA